MQRRWQSAELGVFIRFRFAKETTTLFGDTFRNIPSFTGTIKNLIIMFEFVVVAQRQYKVEFKTKT